MAEKYVDLNDLRFLIDEVHDLKSIISKPFYQDHNREDIGILINAIKDFADKEMFPSFREMDEQPAYYRDGIIDTHPQLGEFIRKAGEMGLYAVTHPMEHGGMQLPYMINSCLSFIMDAANNNLPGYIGLTVGAADLIATFGDDTLRERFLPDMMSGNWGGTMCLTEPQAGSSLSDVTTTAYPSESGHYSIKGQKIFISGGDHEHSENFVHLVLARIDGAPAGTKGISLFAVPKKRKDANGSLVSNDVITAGDFQKMGQRGYCTTHLVFGENEDCRGWIVGPEHRGLSQMFQMMNKARIDVGRGAAAIAQAAYQASLQYAKERPQGRRINESGRKDLSSEQTLIINHPDVRRMLFLQKSIAEGSLALIMETSYFYDRTMAAESDDERNDFHLLLELLTPVAKTYPSEMGRTSVENGLQILGGYGFCSEFVLQQYLRDIRIFALYEGTTGIQSLDLLGRKVTIQNGKAFQLLAGIIMGDIKEAMVYDDIKPYAKEMAYSLELTTDVLMFLSEFAKEGKFERFLSDATIFMEYFGTFLVGWQWLKMATSAKKSLLTQNSDQSQEFYESKIHTMRFYFKYQMNRLQGMANILKDENVLTIQNEKEVFNS